MPFRSGLPDAVRGVAAVRLGLPSGPAGTGFGKFRHCAAAGSARKSVIAVVASEIRMTVIVCAPFLRVGHSIRGRRCRCTRRHASCFVVSQLVVEDSEMTPTRYEIEALVMRIQDEFLRTTAVRMTLEQI